MTVFRLKLDVASEQSDRLLTQASRTSSAARMALASAGFFEHVMWPEKRALHLVVEGDGDPDHLGELMVGFLGGEGWEFEATELPVLEQIPHHLVGDQRSRAIVRMAVEPPGTRCDLCEAVDPPPHNSNCTYAKRDDVAPTKPQDSGPMSGVPSGQLLMPGKVTASPDAVLAEL